MNRVYDALSDKDLLTIRNYIKTATGIEPVDDTHQILEAWNDEKDWLFHNVFGDRLRFSVSVKAQALDTDKKLRRGIADASLAILSDVFEFILMFEYNGMCPIGTSQDALSLFRYDTIIKGVVDKDYSFGFCSDRLFIPEGTKTMKAIRKMLEFFQYGNMEVFVRFRDQISVVLTTKKIEADIVFSIHPIDFFSMSDNSCGWNTCTSWVTKNGKFSSGALEMMNSTCAIVAYIESDEPFMDGVPNKSWRELIFVDKYTHAILGGRQYPYHSDTLAKVAVSTIADILDGADIDSVVTYPKTTFEQFAMKELDNSDVKEASDKYFEGHKLYGDGIVPYTYGMCNDFFMFAEDSYFKYPGDGTNRRFCLSGPATCAVCGDTLDMDYTHAGKRIGTDVKICKECEEVYGKACRSV